MRQKTLYNWVSAALISGAATVRFKEMNIYAMEIFPNSLCIIVRQLVVLCTLVSSYQTPTHLFKKSFIQDDFIIVQPIYYIIKLQDDLSKFQPIYYHPTCLSYFQKVATLELLKTSFSSNHGDPYPCYL